MSVTDLPHRTRTPVRTSTPTRRARRVGAASLGLVAALGWLGAAAGAASMPRATHPQIHVGGFPTGMSLDPTTDTVYVGNGTDDNLSLINGRTCNSIAVSGCGQHIIAVTAGTDPIGSVVDPSTNTIYAINASSGTVAVISGGTCDAANTAGCGATPALIRVGARPEFGALNPRTHTLYVANLDSNNVSVIDLRQFNAQSVAGCPHAVVGIVPSSPYPFAVAVDIPSNTIYVTNDGANTVTVINGRTCNAVIHSGCSHTAHEFVGLRLGGITVDQRTNTV
jgi:DNA-binding beta-propeller fold protein YncE